jgi:exopolysaccharide production protein ExoZ
MKTAAAPRNHHIQALRGIAASLVVIDHAIEPLTQTGVLPAWLDPVRINVGVLGVYTFFVISGFIMITTAYEDFGHLSKSITFAARRVIRIVPMYWMATLAFLALITAFPKISQQPSVSNLVASLTFIPYSIDPTADMQPILRQGWTLNYEMSFYTLFTIALVVPRWIGLPGLFLTFIGIVIAGSWLKPFSDATPTTTALTFLSAPVILLFAAGMAIGVLKQKSHILVRCPLLIVTALLATQIALFVILKIPPRLPFPACIETWIPGILAVAVCVFAAPSSWGGRFKPISEMLGDASYSTYLFHMFVIFVVIKVFPKTTELAIPFVLAALVTSNLFGILLFRIIEQPLTRFLRIMQYRLNPPREIAVIHSSLSRVD